MKTPAVLAIVSTLCLVFSIEAERAVFTGLTDLEPIKAGFKRDRVIQHSHSFQILSGDNPVDGVLPRLQFRTVEGSIQSVYAQDHALSDQVRVKIVTYQKST